MENYQFIDIHYHADPDLYKRRLNAIEAGRCYQGLKGAVVLKSHLGATTVQATLAQSMGLPVFPSLALNHIAGGIDYRVIMRGLAEYQSAHTAKMIVDFPTITGRQYQSKLSRQLTAEHLSQQTLKPETLFNKSNDLRKEVIDILKMASEYPIVLSTGHASKEEVFSLIDACIKYKVPSLLLNQPANPLTGLEAKDLKKLAENEFVWIEQTALTFLLGHQTKDDFVEVLTRLPRVIYSSDLGQLSQIEISQWLVESKKWFDEFKLSEQRKDELMHKNAYQLLKISSKN
ncbi:MAG: hypothetical protein H0U57_04720 [Tatlockia sp.]|nr:hypothetical protein [Tatlockia sp.]